MPELKLKVQVENQPERLLRITQDEFIIGRMPSCDLSLPFSEVSRQHAKIRRLSQPPGRWTIEDLGSTNGTLINQVRISQPQLLHHGDTVQIGNVQLAVQLAMPMVHRITQAEGKGEVKTILRDAAELQQEWLEAERMGDPLSTHQTAISRLKDLVEIAKKLSLAESIQAIFNQVQTVVFRELVSVERLALLIDVHQNGELELIQAAAKDFPPDHPLVRNSAWISRTVCQRAFSEKVAIKSVDAQLDERFEGEHSILAKGIRGVLASPLWDQDRVVGVLYADAHLRFQDSDPLEDEDLSFFSTIANLMASSVQRWLLTRKLQGEAQIRQKLERYHSPAVVQQLISVGALDDGRLPPSEAEITILFADIVGFTALSERLKPKAIASLLNVFFEEMLHSVFDAGGTLDKFIGDCIMAFFGAPEPQPNHAERAVAAALGMLNRLDQLNSRGILEPPLQLRIAINSGKAFVGDVGSSQRVDYTVLGATVNLASRMESICPPGECVISEATYRQLKQRDHFFSMGAGKFRGIDRAVRVYRTQRHPHPGGDEGATTSKLPSPTETASLLEDF